MITTNEQNESISTADKREVHFLEKLSIFEIINDNFQQKESTALLHEILSIYITFIGIWIKIINYF